MRNKNQLILLKYEYEYEAVHQLVAYHTLIQVHKIIISEKPRYLSNNMKIKCPQDGSVFPHRQSTTINVNNKNLSISRAGFVFRSAQLFNNLPQDIRNQSNHKLFKSEVKKWTKDNVSIKAP